MDAAMRYSKMVRKIEICYCFVKVGEDKGERRKMILRYENWVNITVNTKMELSGGSRMEAA